MSRLWLFLALLGCLELGCGLDVVIDYSFTVPERWGVGVPETVGCCPYAKLPKNGTHGMTTPSIFGIGVQKGGTTTLYDHLKRHPQLYQTTKELHYLDSAGKETYKSYLRAWKWNKGSPKAIALKNGTIHEIREGPARGGLFEISPSYLYVPFAACKAKVISPNAKFVVLLRDPADRAYSGLSYSAHLMGRRSGFKYSWMKKSFWSLVKKGLTQLEKEPSCDFQTGKGVNSYNDCLGCMLRWRAKENHCQLRPFVTLTDKDKGYKCNFVGKEHILRGLYGAQLAWWFTLFHPSQFKIINSDDFFKDTMTVMKEIGFFLDVHPAYAKWMLRTSKEVANKGTYRKDKKRMVDLTKKLLKEFYKRPNLELYRLLQETGHGDFKPFESVLQEEQTLNCADRKVIQTGVCGDPRFLAGGQSPVDATLPENVSRAIHTLANEIVKERPKKDGEALMTELSAKRTQSTLQNKEAAKTILTESVPEEDIDTELDAQQKANLTVGDETVSEVQEKPDLLIDARESKIQQKPDLVNQEKKADNQEKSDGNNKDEIESKTPQVNTTIEEMVEDSESAKSVDAVTDSSTQLGYALQHPVYSNRRRQSDLNSQSLSHDAQLGMTRADIFVHVLFAILLVGFIYYGFRCVK